MNKNETLSFLRENCVEITIASDNDGLIFSFDRPLLDAEARGFSHGFIAAYQGLWPGFSFGAATAFRSGLKDRHGFSRGLPGTTVIFRLYDRRPAVRFLRQTPPPLETLRGGAALFELLKQDMLLPHDALRPAFKDHRPYRKRHHL